MPVTEGVGEAVLPQVLARVNETGLNLGHTNLGVRLRSNFWVLQGDILFAPTGPVDGDIDLISPFWAFVSQTDIPKSRTKTSTSVHGRWIEFCGRDQFGAALFRSEN